MLASEVGIQAGWRVQGYNYGKCAEGTEVQKKETERRIRSRKCHKSREVFNGKLAKNRGKKKRCKGDDEEKCFQEDKRGRVGDGKVGGMGGLGGEN